MRSVKLPRIETSAEYFERWLMRYLNQTPFSPIEIEALGTVNPRQANADKRGDSTTVFVPTWLTTDREIPHPSRNLIGRAFEENGGLWKPRTTSARASNLR